MKNQYFFSEDWMNILKTAFRAKHQVFMAGEERIVIVKFPKTMLSIAYPNFPIGIKSNVAVQYFSNLHDSLNQFSVFGIRLIINQQEFSLKNHDAAHIHQLPITYVPDLQKWELNQVKSSIKRNIRKSLRENVDIKPVSDINESQAIYEIYTQTVKKHDGKLRYNYKYFSVLIKSILSSKDVIGYVAYHPNGQLIGYMITAFHDDVAYYLHGGIEYKYQSMRVMDALFARSIEHSKNEGLTQYNFLASPISQPNLIAYKEKWGAVTEKSCTLTLTKSRIINYFLSQKNKRHIYKT